jgi:hypothetical protein
MSASVHEVTGGRLQIREGGGSIALFGLPFFAAGVFAVLGAAGVVPVSNPGGVSDLARPLLLLLGLVFTAVGGTLVFGRKWTILDAQQRRIVRQWGLLVPLREDRLPLDGYSAVNIGFVKGDSETADRFPVSLRSRTGADVRLCSPTAYAEARAAAVAVAQHLRLDLEDATTDHPTREPVDDLGRPLQSRSQRSRAPEPAIARPSTVRSSVTRDADRLQVVIPLPRTHPVALVAGLLPLLIPAVAGPWLATFFKQTHTPDPIGWVFLGLLVLGFGVLPATTTLNALIRSRRGATIVSVSREGIVIRERGAWTTRTVASIGAADIIDVDYSTRESASVAARRAAEQQVKETPQFAAAEAALVNPRVERLLAALLRFVKSGGLTVKTTQGLTTFGAGLEDEEVQYLHAIVRRALQGHVVDPEAFA